MFVLLMNTDTLQEDGIYIHTSKFTDKMERLFIELYYRDAIEGLVESVDTVKLNNYNVLEMDTWLQDKIENTTDERSLMALNQLQKYL